MVAFADVFVSLPLSHQLMLADIYTDFSPLDIVHGPNSKNRMKRLHQAVDPNPSEYESVGFSILPTLLR